MGRWAALLLVALALASVCHGLMEAATSAQWQSPALGRPIPLANIPARAPLPTLPVLSGPVLLDMNAARVTGPGDNSSADDPYVEFTGRLYNERLVAGVIRVKQGGSLRVRVCNSLPAMVNTSNGPSQYGRKIFPFTNGQTYREPNILAHHFHGHYGNPGTDNVPCQPSSTDGAPCFRGDNIFADIYPGSCAEYQYDISPVNSPGTFWMHPHHHGSSTLQTQSASLPVIIDPAPGVGFDYLGTPSCQPYRQFFVADREVILHMQTYTMMVNYNASNGRPDPTTGPIDDGYIAVAVKSTPQDPLCCMGLNTTVPGAGNESWLGIGGEAVPDLENGTVGDGFDPPQTTTLEPWYTSGQNAEFTTINGAYSPVIAMTAGRVYRWRMVQASVMSWVDLSLNASGCTWGVVARDGILLRDLPRVTDHVVMAAANRVDMLVVCEPGVYQLQTGQGPLEDDPGCGSSHCEQLQQPNLATLFVSAEGGQPVNASAPFGPGSPCTPQFPPYLADLRHVEASYDSATHVTYTGLVNFTNGNPGSADSGNCLVNSLLYDESSPLQETIGEVTQLHVENINVHPYHHHTQPYQIVALDNDTAAMDSTWRVGDYVDTLLLPSSGMKNATVRWVPGPVEVTGTGYALLHCHMMPHSDEGCIMKTQILDKSYMELQRKGMSPGAQAGITLAALCAFVALVVVPVMVAKRRKMLRRRQAQEEARSRLVGDVEDDASQ